VAGSAVPPLMQRVASVSALSIDTGLGRAYSKRRDVSDVTPRKSEIRGCCCLADGYLNFKE
jgi:hypothetical protein